jgi:epoxyqueuosine reductase QueG
VEKTIGKDIISLTVSDKIINSWLDDRMKARDVTLWGTADLRAFSTPKDETGKSFPYAVSFAIPMNPEIMESIQNGPNQAYADEYTRVNKKINEISEELASEIKMEGFRSKPLAASVRTDTVNIRGDFPQKTAATRAGLGWVGRNCQLITRSFGPWVRLGTVFTDLMLQSGKPIERNFCGSCMRCVNACPARALKGKAWDKGMPREEILDVFKCDKWKKENYYMFHNGHNCGICASVCPYGLKVLKKKMIQGMC